LHGAANLRVAAQTACFDVAELVKGFYHRRVRAVTLAAVGQCKVFRVAAVMAFRALRDNRFTLGGVVNVATQTAHLALVGSSACGNIMGGLFVAFAAVTVR